MNSNKIKITIISILSIILIIGIIILFFVKINNNTENQLNTGNNTNANNEISIEKRFMLADLLKEENEILITEDNIDKTQDIINRAKLKNGIFIIESSRDKFLSLVNEGTGNIYSINENGYLQKPKDIIKTNDLTDKINNLIDSNNTLVVKISSTYKGLMDDMQLDFMVDIDSYVETFDYNNNIKIAIINPDRIDEESEDLTKKQIYEEVLLGL